MSIYSYRTGDLLRTATADEAARYLRAIEGGSPEGAVDGEAFGFAEPIYMQ